VFFTGFLNEGPPGYAYGLRVCFCGNGFGGLAAGFMLIYKATCRHKTGYCGILLFYKSRSGEQATVVALVTDL